MASNGLARRTLTLRLEGAQECKRPLIASAQASEGHYHGTRPVKVVMAAVERCASDLTHMYIDIMGAYPGSGCQRTRPRGCCALATLATTPSALTSPTLQENVVPSLPVNSMYIPHAIRDLHRQAHPETPLLTPLPVSK